NSECDSQFAGGFGPPGELFRRALQRIFIRLAGKMNAREERDMFRVASERELQNLMEQFGSLSAYGGLRMIYGVFLKHGRRLEEDVGDGQVVRPKRLSDSRC